MFIDIIDLINILFLITFTIRFSKVIFYKKGYIEFYNLVLILIFVISFMLPAKQIVNFFQSDEIQYYFNIIDKYVNIFEKPDFKESLTTLSVVYSLILHMMILLKILKYIITLNIVLNRIDIDIIQYYIKLIEHYIHGS